MAGRERERERLKRKGLPRAICTQLSHFFVSSTSAYKQHQPSGRRRLISSPRFNPSRPLQLAPIAQQERKPSSPVLLLRGEEKKLRGREYASAFWFSFSFFSSSSSSAAAVVGRRLSLGLFDLNSTKTSTPFKIAVLIHSPRGPGLSHWRARSDYIFVNIGNAESSLGPRWVPQSKLEDRGRRFVKGRVFLYRGENGAF